MFTLEGWHWCSFLWWAWLCIYYKYVIEVCNEYYWIVDFFYMKKKCKRKVVSTSQEEKYDPVHKEMMSNHFTWYKEELKTHKTKAYYLIIHIISCVHFFFACGFFFASRKKHRSKQQQTYRGHTLSLWWLLGWSHNRYCLRLLLLLLVVALNLEGKERFGYAYR